MQQAHEMDQSEEYDKMWGRLDKSSFVLLDTGSGPCPWKCLVAGEATSYGFEEAVSDLLYELERSGNERIRPFMLVPVPEYLLLAEMERQLPGRDKDVKHTVAVIDGEIIVDLEQTPGPDCYEGGVTDTKAAEEARNARWLDPYGIFDQDDIDLLRGEF